MKHSMTILVILFTMLMISGCASMHSDLNFPPIRTKTRVTQITYPDEILSTPDFKISTGGWFKPAKFKAYVAEQKLNAPTNLQNLHEANVLAMKPVQVQMTKEVKGKTAAFYSLFFWINQGVDIDFQKGGLIWTLRDAKGNTIEIKDKGCLFVRFEGIKAIPHDSARERVLFNHDFNNKPDYSKKRGNLVYIRTAPQYENWETVSLKLDPQKIFVIK